MGGREFGVTGQGVWTQRWRTGTISSTWQPGRPSLPTQGELFNKWVLFPSVNATKSWTCPDLITGPWRTEWTNTCTDERWVSRCISFDGTLLNMMGSCQMSSNSTPVSPCCYSDRICSGTATYASHHTGDITWVNSHNNFRKFSVASTHFTEEETEAQRAS